MRLWRDIFGNASELSRTRHDGSGATAWDGNEMTFEQTPATSLAKAAGVAQVSLLRPGKDASEALFSTISRTTQFPLSVPLRSRSGESWTRPSPPASRPAREPRDCDGYSAASLYAWRWNTR